MNCSPFGSVHNITDPYRRGVFYSSANTGVIYEYVSGKQHLLQGHCNKISATTLTRDKRWLVTADTGANSLIIVWDTIPRLEISIRNANAQTMQSSSMAALSSMAPLPIKTIFASHGGCGVVAVIFSTDHKHLITLGADSPQTLCIWNWMDQTNTDVGGNDVPIATCTLQGDVQRNIQVNSEDATEILTTGPSSVYFYSWDVEENQISQHTPILNTK